jgi:hypothetical protein
MRSIHGLADAIECDHASPAGGCKLFIDNNKKKRHLLGMPHPSPIKKRTEQ